MATVTSEVLSLNGSYTKSIQAHVERVADDLLASFPEIEGLTADQRRGIIARYTAVLEGNFIYWMTGALLSVKSEEARSKIVENLTEEVRDCHPGMLRKFTMSAHALPNTADVLAVYEDMSKVRLFIGKMSPVPVLVMMAFFEGFIQKFMAYLADLARRQGSTEMVYTDVHGVCDITHTAELFNALEVEMALAQESGRSATNLFEGVDLLATVIRDIAVNPAS